MDANDILNSENYIIFCSNISKLEKRIIENHVKNYNDNHTGEEELTSEDYISNCSFTIENYEDKNGI